MADWESELEGISGDELFTATVSIECLQGLFDVSKSTLYKLASEGWIPKPVNKKWHFAECVRGFLNYQRDLIIQKHVEKRF